MRAGKPECFLGCDGCDVGFHFRILDDGAAACQPKTSGINFWKPGVTCLLAITVKRDQFRVSEFFESVQACSGGWLDVVAVMFQIRYMVYNQINKSIY